tara:strand:- start:3765 stop:4082 length:318 start_codon:yes stop_codon:yes gene_type:complete
MIMTKSKEDDPLFTTEEAARFLRLAPSTLATWRVRKSNAIPYFKFGRVVVYPRSGLEEYKRKCLRRSTAEYGLPSNEDAPNTKKGAKPATKAKTLRLPGAGENLP